MHPRFFVLAALALVSACGMNDSTPKEVIESSFKSFPADYQCIEWKGTNRCYFVVPPAQGKPHHLIVALHPAFTSVELTEKVSHLAKTAVPQGYLVVYPEGIDKQWNDGRIMTDVKTYNLKSDDVGFIDEVARRVRQQYALDVGHSTVAGMSNGGMMSLRMACQSNQYGAVATVVANLPKGLRDQCTATPKPMLMMWGTDDDIVEYHGGILADSGKPETWGEVESAEDTEAFFIKRNGCAPARLQVGTLADDDIDGTVAHARQYENCGEAPLRTITIEGMGHTWPGEESRLLAWITTRGRVTKQFNAGNEILKFIQENQK